ncbi:serine hydrolase domain-containing protein [Microbacterium sp. RD1]|uniref:serine hydrolase domain-containing protein n=1 Tax=Microbacterium sp. RD1 TaxID=3457313 RepID=UPI003FA5ECDF
MASNLSGSSLDTVSGFRTPRFDGVAEELQRQLASGEEVGASVAVVVDGELVVDLWGGWQDPERQTPWQQDTIVNLWSNTKLVVTLAFLRLVDDGRIDLDAPVATYWPEFAAAGKAGVRVRDVLSHSSGVSGLDHPATLADLYDTETAVARMAAQSPWWEPGTASGYHLFNFGHLVGEIVRRVTGQDLRTFVDETLVAPLGADLRIGALETDAPRIATLVPPPPLPFDLEDLDHSAPVYRTFTGPAIDPLAANTPQWRAAQVGGANGHGNARSLATVLSVLAEGGSSQGMRFFSEEVAAEALRANTDGVDLVNGLYLRWALGFAVSDERTLPWVPTGQVGYWGGWGGSMGIVDRDRRVAVAYVMNRMGGDILGSDRARAYVDAIYAGLGA